MNGAWILLPSQTHSVLTEEAANKLLGNYTAFLLRFYIEVGTSLET